MKRWWFWMGTLLLVLVAGCLIIPLGASRISQANCDKIQLGMTPTQVIEILGEHPLPTGVERGVWGDLYLAWYDDDDNRVEVRFAGQSGVTEKVFTPTGLSLYGQAKLRIARRIDAIIDAIWP